MENFDWTSLGPVFGIVAGAVAGFLLGYWKTFKANAASDGVKDHKDLVVEVVDAVFQKIEDRNKTAE